MRRTGLVAAVMAVMGLAVGVSIAVSLTKAPANPKGLFANLNGVREVDSNGETASGDLNGKGTFSGTFDGGKLCFGLTVANIGKPAAAHIHRGEARTNGPVVLSLKQPGKGDPGASSACTSIEKALAKEIRDNPGDFYVNVHNAVFPEGAVRGQLFRSAGK